MVRPPCTGFAPRPAFGLSEMFNPYVALNVGLTVKRDDCRRYDQTARLATATSANPYSSAEL